jgi:amino-acid N-acetyltransferase
VIEIRRPRESDFAPIRQLLIDANLPVDDFVAEHLVFVASVDEQPVAAIGYEGFGDTWLLRSLVVDEEHRSHGLGARLVAALEDSAREQGVAEIWLLTVDADGFFRSLAYRLRERDTAPAAIRGTVEFSELCPTDAILMSRSLLL